MVPESTNFGSKAHQSVITIKHLIYAFSSGKAVNIIDNEIFDHASLLGKK